MEFAECTSELTRLYVAHRERLCKAAARYGLGAEQAEDSVQTVFLRILTSHQRGITRHIEYPYLYRAVVNEALHERKRENRAAKLHDAFRIRSVTDVQTLPQHRSITGETLKAAFDSLPTRSRQVFELIRFDGLTYAEAADRMGVSTHTVKTHLHRATCALRNCLRGRAAGARL